MASIAYNDFFDDLNVDSVETKLAFLILVTMIDD